MLTGFVRVLDTAPSFVVPIFRGCSHGESHETPALVTQLAAFDHSISGFLAFDVASSKIIQSSKPLEVRIGAQCLAAYELGNDNILVGTVEDLRASLQHYVQSPIFDNKPFSQWEVCEFCDRIDIFPEIAKKIRRRDIASKTPDYFLANCLAKRWVGKYLPKKAQERENIEDRSYKLFVKDGKIAFSIDEPDPLIRNGIALCVNSFNELMAMGSL